MERDPAEDDSNRPHRNYNPHSGDLAAPTNPRLLDVMRAVALNESPQTREALYRELKAATFVLPQTEPAPGHVPGLSWYEEGQPFAALAERDLQGRLVLPVFTDTTALFAWAPPEASYVAMPAATLFALVLRVKADVVVINVAGPTGGELTRAEVLVLVQGGVPGPEGSYSFPEGGEVLVRRPDPEPPEGLVRALWRAAAQQPSIESVYLVDAIYGKGEPHLLAGVEFSPMPDPAEVDATMRAVVEGLREWLDADRYVDLMVLVPGEPVERDIKARGMRVYSRLFG